jgi:hypothetical protein
MMQIAGMSSNDTSRGKGEISKTNQSTPSKDLSGSKLCTSLSSFSSVETRRRSFRTFWDVEAWQLELSVSDASFPAPSIADHARDEISHELDMLHKFFRRHFFRQRGEGKIRCLQDLRIFVVEAIQ